LPRELINTFIGYVEPKNIGNYVRRFYVTDEFIFIGTDECIKLYSSPLY
jgi:hypothetical protein